MARIHFENHPEFPYHITARCINRDWFGEDPSEIWKIMSRQLYFVNFAFNLKIHAFVLMGNHYHLIARSPDANLSQAIGYFNRETSREITGISGRINQTYGSRFHRSLIGSPLYYLHAYKYLYRNPVEAGLCLNVEDYPYSSIQGLLGNSWLDIPVCEDDNWGNFANREQTLSWLNRAPIPEHWDLVRKALKKKEFKLSKINREESSLEFNAL
ncbi:MAG: transposase [Bdellovibrio sp.]|nr:transposase [Bdellovibrio sp.]